jgi:hypothetical protein
MTRDDFYTLCCRVCGEQWVLPVDDERLETLDEFRADGCPAWARPHADTELLDPERAARTQYAQAIYELPNVDALVADRSFAALHAAAWNRLERVDFDDDDGFGDAVLDYLTDE